ACTHVPGRFLCFSVRNEPHWSIPGRLLCARIEFQQQLACSNPEQLPAPLITEVRAKSLWRKIAAADRSEYEWLLQFPHGRRQLEAAHGHMMDNIKIYFRIQFAGDACGLSLPGQVV